MRHTGGAGPHHKGVKATLAIAKSRHCWIGSEWDAQGGGVGGSGMKQE